MNMIDESVAKAYCIGILQGVSIKSNENSKKYIEHIIQLLNDDTESKLNMIFNAKDRQDKDKRCIR